MLSILARSVETYLGLTKGLMFMLLKMKMSSSVSDLTGSSMSGSTETVLAPVRVTRSMARRNMVVRGDHVIIITIGVVRQY